MTVAKTTVYVNHHITRETWRKLSQTASQLLEDRRHDDAKEYRIRATEQKAHLEALESLRDRIAPGMHENAFRNQLNWLLDEGWKPPENWSVQTVTETLEDDSEE